MLPKEFSKEDQVWVEKNTKTGIKQPKDLNDFIGLDFTSLYFLRTSSDKIKKILLEIYKMNEELVKKLTSYSSNSDSINSFISDVLNLDVFKVLDFEVNPKDKSIWVRIESKNPESQFQLVTPLRRGAFISENEAEDLNIKSKEIFKYVEDLFYKGFGKKLNL